jgi:C1A family cysteine protease
MAASPQQRIAELEAKVRVYEGLHEDVIAQRVLVRARKQLTLWITCGGVAVFALGFFGFGSLQNFAKKEVHRKVDQVTSTQVEHSMRAEVKRDVQQFISPYLNAYANQLNKNGPIDSQAARGRGRAESPHGARVVARLDYSTQMQPVRDAGQEGSVVGFAVASALEYQLQAHRQQTIRISPRYLYYFARKAGGLDLHADSGANLGDAVSVLATKGAVADSAWPYKEGHYADAPPAAVAEAKHYHARGRALHGSGQIRAALQQDGPVVAGITIYKSFESAGANATGAIPDPRPNDAVQGGHAICIVGYDDSRHRFKFENSWGSRWGDHGYGYLSYDYMEKHGAGAWALS